MAKNDIILVDNIVKERIECQMPSQDRGEVYEYLANEQILKDFDLSKEALISGSVDGRNDGGIDSMYVFINGNILTDPSDFMWPKKCCELTVYIITSKHHDTFVQEVINNEYATISEIFDLSKSNEELNALYNKDLIAKRYLFIEAYTRMASYLNSLSFIFCYASRGDTDSIGENIIARTEQIKYKMSELFSNCNTQYTFVGSSEILALYRRRPEYELKLRFNGAISYKDECYVVLCNLRDFNEFITDKNGRLKKYLFDSNVRDYMGVNSVNIDIMASLTGGVSTDFWWLNNGITVLATSAINVGNYLKIQNVQIVNGLQTSQTIFQYFKDNNIQDEERCVMIKVISQNDVEIRDNIIRSTNNQTAIQAKSLFATDKIQRNIEDIMRQSGLYYERRINCFANIDIESNLVFDIMYMAAGYLGLVLKAPERAANFKQKFFKDTNKYSLLFNPNDPLTIWPILAKMLRRTDICLKSILKDKSNFNTEKMLKRSRYVIAIITIARILRTYNFSISQLISLDLESYTDEIIKDVWTLCVEKWYNKENMLKRFYIIEILTDASEIWGIADLDSFKYKNNIFINASAYEWKKQLPEVSEELVKHINSKLPPQPWKVGAAKEVAKQLRLDNLQVYSAINILIKRGIRYRQRDGIVYDKCNHVLMIDEERVDKLHNTEYTHSLKENMDLNKK